MNLTDLRDVLDERSSTDRAEDRSHLTLSGVRHRLVIRRRRRIAAAAAAVVAVLAVGAGSLAISRDPATHNHPAASPTTINGLPEYAEGTRLIASAVLVPPAKSIVLPFTPGSTTLTFFVHCTDSAKEFELTVNGHQVASGPGCGTSFRPAAGSLDSKLGVRVGERSVLKVTFKAGAPADFIVGVGQGVAIDQYVFPSRPAALSPLNTGDNLSASYDGSTEYHTTFLLRPDPADPNRPVSRTFTWGKGGAVALRSQTPGALTVAVNGVTVASGEWWDYDQGLVDGATSDGWPSPKQRTRGVTVTITVTPQRMTGDWAVAFQEPS